MTARASLARLVGYMGLFGFLALLGTLIVVTLDQRARLWRGAAQELQSTAYLLADHADRLLEVSDVGLRAASAVSEGRVWDEIQRSESVFRELRALKSALPYVEDVWLNDETGLLRLTTFAFPAPYSNAADRDVFKAQLQPTDRLYIGERIIGRVTGRPSFLVARRLEHADGSFRGMASVTADLAYYNDYWGRVPLPYDAQVTLVRADSFDVLAQHPRPGDGHSFAPFGAEALKGSIAAMPRGGSFSFAPNGDSRIGSYQQIGDQPVYLTVTVSEKALSRVWLERARNYGLFGAAASLALGALMATGFRQARREAAATAALQRAQADLAETNAGLETTVTERTAELRRSEARASLVLESATDIAIMTTDMAGLITQWNVGATNLLGWSEAEAVGQNARMLFTLDDRAAGVPEAELGKALTEGRAPDERWHIRKDGSRFYATGAMLPKKVEGRTIGFLKIMRDRTKEREADEAMRDLNATLERLVAERTAERDRLWELSEDLIVLANYEQHLLRVSPSWTQLLGHDESTLLMRPYTEIIHPDDLGMVTAAIAEMRRSNSPARFENRVRAADGSWRWVAWRLASEPNGERLYGVGRDVTADRLKDEQLRQAQKMEAVGRLTGGVAHDFNNLLTVVTGNLDILQRRLGEDADARVRRLVEHAIEGANRAATLTNRLLAFSRQQPLAPEAVDANKLVAGMSDLLQRALGEHIAIETVLAGGLWRTHADPNQVENALLNLAVNARDAMPEGGKLTIETANAYLDDAYAAMRDEVKAGQYVLIAVCDTGTGMSPDVMARAFEPFYTTKAIGKGTGLGLSQVYGFVKQSGGHTAIYSEPGQGTTIKLYLPRYRSVGDVQTADPATRRVEAATPSARGETVLLVEDDRMVREFSVSALEEAGYHVLAAEDGPSGLALLDVHPEVALLFTDVVLTGPMNGRKVADEALRRRPGLKVLFTTGYTRNAIIHHGRLDEDVELIGKPFTAASLAEKVRRVLDHAAF